MNDNIRTKAQEHFAYFVELAERHGSNVELAKREEQIGLAIVETVLPLEAGVAFDLGAWLADSGYPESAATLSFSVLPFICGSLGLLEWVPEHAQLGRLPWSAVRDLLKASSRTIEFQGVQLTGSTVILNYYRR